MYCVYCSKLLDAGSGVCSGCNADLKERLLKCTACRYQALEGDLFCLRCGTSLGFKHTEKKFVPSKPLDDAYKDVQAAMDELNSISASLCFEPEKQAPLTPRFAHDTRAISEENANEVRETNVPSKKRNKQKKPTVPRWFIVAWIAFLGILSGAGLFLYFNWYVISGMFAATR